MLGDRVQLGSDSGGTIVCIIEDDAYTADHPREQWAYLNKGLMAEFPTHGLIHYETLEEDIIFIGRK